MMHIAYYPYLRKINNLPTYFSKICKLSPTLVQCTFFGLGSNLRFCFPYFDHDAFTHHVLRVLDAPARISYKRVKDNALEPSSKVQIRSLISKKLLIGTCSAESSLSRADSLLFRRSNWKLTEEWPSIRNCSTMLYPMCMNRPAQNLTVLVYILFFFYYCVYLMVIIIEHNY